MEFSHRGALSSMYESLGLIPNMGRGGGEKKKDVLACFGQLPNGSKGGEMEAEKGKG